MNTKISGTWGEAQVAGYLRKRGYTLIASQYRCRWGEIDLIAKKGSMLCMVEVKTRTGTKMGLPREAVNFAKQQRLRSSAAFYLSSNELDCPVRFDVAEVYTDETLDVKKMKIVYLENAFG